MRTLALLADPSGVLRRLKRWRGGLGSAALALALLAGQSGALLHEFSHYASALAAASESKAPKSDHDGKLCDICLAFAQVAGAVHCDSFNAPLVADLKYSVAIFAAPAQADGATPAPRSRSPPVLS